MLHYEYGLFSYLLSSGLDMVKHDNSKTKIKSFHTSVDALYGSMMWAHIHNGGVTESVSNSE